MKKITVYSFIILMMWSVKILAHEGGIVFITCTPIKISLGGLQSDRDIILDTDTGRLDITAFKTNEWQRGIAFENGVERITFQILQPDYYEGWAINRESLTAVFRLEVIQPPDAEETLDPVVRRMQCTKEERETKNQI